MLANLRTRRRWVGVLVAGLSLVACGRAESPAPQVASAEYRSPEYGYAFTYPDTLDLHVYTPDHVALGRGEGDSFTAVVEIGVFKDTEAEPISFEDFVLDRARTLCAADGPSTSLRCTDVQQRAPFETATGLTGEAFYLKHETVEIPSGRIVATNGRGPFFAFNLSANVPQARYALLLIRPPTTLEPSAVDSGLVRGIAESVRIDRVETRSAPR